MRIAAADVRKRAIERLGGGPKARRRPDEWRINDPASRRLETELNKPIPVYQRERLRFVFDINPFAVKAKSSILNNLVGYGITGTIKGTRALQNAWTGWEKVCDFDGVYDLYGLQALIASIWLDDGEVFIVQRIVPGGAVHPLRLQVLDVDMLDTTAAVADMRIRDGIEYADGKPVAYHFKRSREIASYGNPVRVPAEQVIHLFHRTRSGQWRGRPFFESVLDALDDTDDYLEAEGIRKKIEACFVGFRSPSLEGDDPAIGTIETDTADPDMPPEESFYPGMIVNGRPGETMTFGEPKAGGGLGEFMQWAGRRIAAGSRATYEHVTGDLSNVNYSSYRAGNLEFQRFIGRLQWLLFIPRLLNPIAEWWTDVGYATGLVNARAPTFKWTPPPFGSVDPGKDIKAKREEMAAGVESLRNVAAERGYDLDELTDEIAADIAMLEEKGLDALVQAMFAKLTQSGGQGEQAAKP
jgi:lambda family phage portal protein